MGEVERFRSVLARRLGLQFDDAKSGFLGDVLRRRLAATHRDCERYLRNLEGRADQAELGALAQELTVPETYFFRNIDQFRAFSELVVPERIRTGAGGRRLRVLSAGCASGEEAYSLAILLRDAVDSSWRTSIRAVDINPAVLEKAQRGRFSTWALRETPPDVQCRWFAEEGRDVVLDDAIREAVQFEWRNLAEDDPDLWQPERYDVVFCRNVIMYLTPESSRALVARITRALAPGGYLFLGHAETLRGLSQEFHLCHTHGTFYYQRKDSSAPAISCGPVGASQGSAGVEPLATLVDESATWVDTIRLATERVQDLVDAQSARAAPHEVAAPARARPRWDLGRPLELLREERFAAALDLVNALPPDAADDPDVLLLQAVLLTHAGLLSRAEAACRRLLEIDELSAGAHYLLALCREGAGDRSGAIDHDRVAIHLDPDFAMPRLHLGLLARRVGDSETVRLELGNAVTLLQREDPSRLLLFGGGFSREALTTLCRAGMDVGGETV
ncbi:MAG: CheR family methyltransferase [Acidimicrobiia bacterium]|jgi:chemotaxis protein methyltransferase CheR